jgi:membrane dipeptidase
MVDLSHTADDTARQALKISKAPVFFSHSGARSVFNHTRNLPDDILESISEKSGRDSFV